MKTKPFYWVGIFAAAIAGGLLAAFFLSASGHWREQLSNPEVIGAAIGSLLTIVATLMIGEIGRVVEQRRRSRPLLQFLRTINNAMGEVKKLTTDQPLTDRAEALRLSFGAIAGATRPLEFARSQLEISSLGVWLDLEMLERDLASFQKASAAAKPLLEASNVTEDAWEQEREVFITFWEARQARLDSLTKSLSSWRI
jgi:hypothetical protein